MPTINASGQASLDIRVWTEIVDLIKTPDDMRTLLSQWPETLQQDLLEELRGHLILGKIKLKIDNDNDLGWGGSLSVPE